MKSPPKGRRNKRERSHPAPDARRQRSARAETGGATGTTLRPWMPPLVLALAIALAFLPAFSAGFVQWDDPTYVTENAALRSVAGLRDLWNPLADQPGGYFPLVFTSYWIEYHVWQLAPAGYHATNVLLHALNAILVLSVARALGASSWVALGAAAVFGLHPAQAESVAWVTERKNTLSCLFYLITFLLYLRHRRSGSRKAYAASLLAFGAGLLSKPEIVTLPLILFVTDVLLQRTQRLPRAPLAQVALKLAPMLALAACSSLIVVGIDRRVRADWVSVPALGQRLLLALNVPWFYLATFLAPVRLAPIYPKWHLAFTDTKWWIGSVAWAPVLFLLWRYRRRLENLWVWGAVQFCVTLIPVLGVVSFNYQQESYVADRFLYFSCIGGAVAVAALAEQLARSARPSARRAVVLAAAVLLVASGVGTYLQTRVWSSDFSLWTAVIKRNPNSFPPNINLARHYAAQGRWVEAADFYRRAHQIKPNNTWAFRGYLGALGKTRGPQAVADACSVELQTPTPLADDAYLFRAVSYEILGQPAAALADYNQVLELTQPGSKEWQQAQEGRERLARTVHAE
jgi:tetratricopeptide (TPR) repeat protein